MRGSLRSAVVAAAAAAAVAVPFAGTASADVPAPQPSAAYAGGAVVSNGETAVVRVAYTCTSTVSLMNHLFVAVKQGPNVSPDNSSSAAGDVTTFLSTNWSSDQGPNALTCDGKRHVQQIVLEPQPGFGVALAKGDVLVQICLYDNVTGLNDDEEPVGGFAPSYTMQRAVITHAPGR
jgi:hypothetical protein